MSCSEGGGPGEPVDGRGVGGLEGGSGPKSTESRDQNDSKLRSGGGKKRGTSLSGGDVLCSKEMLPLVF